MTLLKPDGPNAKQIEFWNTAGGAKWVRLQAMLDRMIEPYGAAVIDRAQLLPGHSVLDVGCGCGATSIALARAVGTGGRVTGIDISAPMLARAAELARESGAVNVAFENADAQTHELARAEVDRIFSRFGVMFFSDSRAAFENLATALKPGGRLAFVCWQPIHDNPWMLLPIMTAMQFMELPLPSEPRAPGPFAFADPDYVRGFLTDAGFTEVEIEPMARELWVGGTDSVEEAVSFLMTMGPLGEQMEQQPTEVRARLAEALCEALEPYSGSNGVRMPSAAWLVSAVRP